MTGRSWRQWLCLATCASLAAVAAAAQAPAGEEPGAPPGSAAVANQGNGRGATQSARQTIKPIKPGFYMVTGAGGNTSVRVTSDGLIVVDTKNLGEAFYNSLLDQIRMVSNQMVKYAFVTHHHQDHSGNIGRFAEAGAQVIAHDNLKVNLATYAPAQGKPANPTVTYTTEYVVKLGSSTAEAHYYGRGHTNGDTFVYFPDLKIVATGDMFVATTPNCDYPFGGSLVEWSRTLDSLLKLDFEVAIPGHGEDPMTRSDVQAFKQKIDTLVARGAELVRKGTAKDRLLSQIRTDDLGWTINTAPWTTPARLDPLYQELSEAK